MKQISGNLVNIFEEQIYPATIFIENGRIVGIKKRKKPFQNYILPGFVDAHVHIESSMLTPYEFGRMAMPHGTVATVSDPHEIANVLGLEGVYYMLENAKTSPFQCFFGAPSCVPATIFETAGAQLGVKETEEMLQRKDIWYLSEMMNFPGVLFKDADVLDKIALAKKYKKPVDGHAPALRGEQAKQYFAAGISTDHECFTYEEAYEKIQLGVKIIIREGSAAKNFEALIPLIQDFSDQIMFCSDDKHPNDLAVGHINELVVRALEKGFPLYNVLKAACVNPVLHYHLPMGLLRVGEDADFIVMKDLEHFKVKKTFIKGEIVASNGKSNIPYQSAEIVNHFNCEKKKSSDFDIKIPQNKQTIKVIEALNGQLVTNALDIPITPRMLKGDSLVADIENDLLKITVTERYQNGRPAIAFIKNFGLKKGAIAASVGHDSHNIIAVGTNDEDICQAVNLIIEQKGGLSLANGQQKNILPLPIAGIMTPENGYQIAKQYTLLDRQAKALGSTLFSPYMTLSFMALLVIPALKLSDKGLFDGNKFEFVDVFGA